MVAATPTLALELDRLPETLPRLSWFAPYACVAKYGDHWEVVVGGLLVARFAPGEKGARNAVLVQVSEDGRIRLRSLAQAFEVSIETLRQLRLQYRREGLQAVIERKVGGSQAKCTPPLRRRLTKLFAKGLSVTEAYERIGKRVSRAVVGTVRKAWGQEKAQAAAAAAIPAPSLPPQTTIEFAASSTSDAPRPPTAETTDETRSSSQSERALSVADAGSSDETPLALRDVEGGGHVQHVGTWLLFAMLHRLGLFARVASLCRKAKLAAAPLRLAIEAFVAALALSQKCAEGVRRLATPTAHLLLRAANAPSAPWVRQTLGALADEAAAALHFTMAGDYIRIARAETDEGPVVFYVDGHLRPYTGQHTLRKGWRMQDKRAVPGKSDYYVHDEDGRPVLRIDVPEHGSLTEFLSPIARSLRMALEPKERVLVAFDRGGAFPSQMAELRDEGFEFVTYERGSYQTLSQSAFDRAVTFVDERGEEETIRFSEGRANLGGGRGRVRRIACLMPDGHQVNMLAISSESAERLIAILRGRWSQENALKYGVERWGINQLDGRKVTDFPEDAIIPNPARRRLDRALKLAYLREGAARCELARLANSAPRRVLVENDLAEALAAQKKLLKLRPSLPTHAPVAETDLAGKLVYHPGPYKATLDALRIACANVESDLATRLAPHLPVPDEAKKTLANLFAAPGDVRVMGRAITVTLSPAGTGPEMLAFRRFLTHVNELALTLPGDSRQRRLCFEVQIP
jgi:hypothetical protein